MYPDSVSWTRVAVVPSNAPIDGIVDREMSIANGEIAMSAPSRTVNAVLPGFSMAQFGAHGRRRRGAGAPNARANQDKAPVRPP
jgi:hypothetical protein